MQIFVNCQGSHLVDFAEDATVETVKEFIQSSEGVYLHLVERACASVYMLVRGMNGIEYMYIEPEE